MTLRAKRANDDIEIEMGDALASSPPASEQQDSPAARPTPQRIGRYELRFELASGGMGSVYLARLQGTGGFEKLVALKRIHPHLSGSKRYVEMFLDEARIASRITHPNVCSVFDFGEVAGEYYLAMEYLLGEPLWRVWKSVARSPEQRLSPYLPLRAASILADACEGLHAAHQLKDATGKLLHVVHRDVSPRNLFVTYDGGVQVVDFGLASARERLHHSVTGEMKGSYAYMAPEQIQGGTIDRRVDIWGAGVALWEMLAVGRLFKSSTTANTLYAVVYEDIPPPSHRNPRVPEELDKIVLKALERDPDKRWQSAREMGQALRGFLSSTKQLVGPAELSAWMAELFPHEQARKAQLMELAHMPAGPVLSLAAQGASDTVMTAEVTAALATLDARPRSRRRVAVWVVGALLTILALGALYWGRDGGSSAREPIAAIAPSETKPIKTEAALGVPSGASETAETLEPEDAPSAEPTLGAEPASNGKPAPNNRRARPKARQRVADRGTVTLVTRGGWAEIFKDGKSLGSTPSVLSLPEGRHTLVLKPSESRPPMRIHVDVVAGGTQKLAVQLK